MIQLRHSGGKNTADDLVGPKKNLGPQQEEGTVVEMRLQ